MKNKEDGFVTPALLIVIFSLCIFLSGISLMLFAEIKKINSIQKKYIVNNEINNLLKQMICDFQSMKNEESDSVFSIEKSVFLNKYSDYKLKLKDLSTGIFEENLNEVFFRSESVKNLLNGSEEKYKSKYGWFNESLCSSKKMEELKLDFEKNKLFPLVNQIPYYNVNEMDVDFINAVLKAEKIKDSEKKAEEIYNACILGEMTFEKLKAILKVYDSNGIFKFLGLKTVFWSLDFEKNNYFCNAVVAGIPDKRLNKIDKYILIESHIEKGI